MLLLLLLEQGFLIDGIISRVTHSLWRSQWPWAVLTSPLPPAFVDTVHFWMISRPLAWHSEKMSEIHFMIKYTRQVGKRE